MRRRKNKRVLHDALTHAREHEGDMGDGGLAIFNGNGALLAYVPPEIASGIRQLIGRLEASNGGLESALGVISALAGEGVAFVSRSLGAVLADDLRRNVVVVELDWAREPDLPNAEVGMAQVIGGTTDLQDALVPTLLPGLTILPAGLSLMSSRPVLARSPVLSDTIAKLRTQFDNIVIELPAVLSTSDALILAGLADGVAVVVQQGVTTEQQVKKAILELGHLPMLGVILNRWHTPVPKRILSAFSP